MNLPLTIAYRYLRRPTDPLVSAVGMVSILGLVIGVMALVISMALMTGYRRDLQRKLLGGNAEIFVYSIGPPVVERDTLLQTIRSTPGVAEASPVLFQHALVTTERSSTGSEVMVKGIEPQRARSTPMIARIAGPRGRFDTDEGEAGVAVGQYLAKKLGVERGSSIAITVPSDNSGSFLPRTQSFVVTNVFATGFYEYDARWLFVDLGDAERLMNAPHSANLVEVKLQEGASLDAAIAALGKRLDARRYGISDWRDLNRQLFSMLKLQQIVLFIVIGLIVFVSTFNIVSTLIMTVHEKRKEIGILSSMGAGQRLVRQIFLWYGSMVGFAGTATGITLGVTICWVMTRYKLLSFPPDIAEVYFVSSIPFITRPIDVGVIAVFALAVSFLATIVPSMRAARMNVVEALRHE
ncbi:MAG TPA: ABC transporter permease [Thermoanaerobaculia bacterium]|nr:ABC transporter permease [Thermoanaerobaculia bacterium]